MARFFGGIGGNKGGSGRGLNGTGAISGSKSSLERAIASKDFMKNAKKKGAQQSNEARYQELVAKKLENAKAALMADKKFKAGNMLPGTAPVEKEMSKSTQIAMELIAQKMAKKEMKGIESKEPLVLKPMHISGMYPGFIDTKGRVYNKTGQVIMKINLETGAVITQGMFGKKICKFDPKSSICFFKMAKELERDFLKRNPSNGGASSLYGSGFNSGDDNNGGGGGGLGW